MSNVQHTDECLKAQAAFKAWREKYPDRCTHCASTGLIRVPGDSVPYGSTTARLPDSYDICEECEGQNKCPRCGATRIWHDDGNPSDGDMGFHEACPSCGYICIACNMAGAEKQEMMPEYECYCWEEAAREEEQEMAEEYERMMAEKGNLCPHGREYHECNSCLDASDRAYDAARESRFMR